MDGEVGITMTENKYDLLIEKFENDIAFLEDEVNRNTHQAAAEQTRLTQAIQLYKSRKEINSLLLEGLKEQVEELKRKKKANEPEDR
jgi:hypothetical protein